MPRRDPFGISAKKAYVSLKNANVSLKKAHVGLKKPEVRLKKVNAPKGSLWGGADYWHTDYAKGIPLGLTTDY